MLFPKCFMIFLFSFIRIKNISILQVKRRINRATGHSKPGGTSCGARSVVSCILVALHLPSLFVLFLSRPVMRIANTIESSSETLVASSDGAGLCRALACLTVTEGSSFSCLSSCRSLSRIHQTTCQHFGSKVSFIMKIHACIANQLNMFLPINPK